MPSRTSRRYKSFAQHGKCSFDHEHSALMVCRSEALGIADDRFLEAVPRNYQWASPTTGPTDYNVDVSATKKLETRRRELEETVRRLTTRVIALEVELQISVRWQPGDVQFEETRKYIATRNYQQALGRLQRLVIQRLFELHKLNISQTGE